jgi:hypothetical protein
LNPNSNSIDRGLGAARCDDDARGTARRATDARTRRSTVEGATGRRRESGESASEGRRERTNAKSPARARSEGETRGTMMDERLTMMRERARCETEIDESVHEGAGEVAETGREVVGGRGGEEDADEEDAGEDDADARGERDGEGG